MGCTSSTEVNQYGDPGNQSEFDQEILRIRQEQENKVRMLLLGAGESGKSTIFKQMRILHGAPRSDDDLRMYGVIVRGNITVAVRKLLSHLRHLGLEASLDKESLANATSFENAEKNDSSGMGPREAYDLLLENLIDRPRSAALTDQNGNKDYVGYTTRAGKSTHDDSHLFLKFVEPIRIIWQVRKLDRTV